MANYPIKMLKDESGAPFVPLISAEAVTYSDGSTLEEKLSTKLDPTNLKGGNNISITTKGYDCYINLDLPASLNIINNLITEEAGQGALDAAQGKILDDKIKAVENKIPEVVNNLTSTSTDKPLSAYQGYLLNSKFNDYLPLSGGTLTGSLYISDKKVLTTEDVNSKVIPLDFSTKFRSSIVGNASGGSFIATVRRDAEGTATEAPRYGSGLAWGRSDTHGYLYVDYYSPIAFVGGGNADKLNWIKQLAFREDVDLRNSCVYLYRSSVMNWTGTQAPAHYNFDNNIVMSGSGLTVNSSGTVTVGKGITKVRVTAHVQTNENDHSGNWIMGYVRKNGTGVVRSITALRQWAALDTQIVMEVKEGDTIDYAVMSDYTGTIVFPTYSSFEYGGYMTNMIVQAIA